MQMKAGFFTAKGHGPETQRMQRKIKTTTDYTDYFTTKFTKEMKNHYERRGARLCAQILKSDFIHE